jgi:flagellin-like protein
MTRKGISPLISTVLLIGFSVALAAVVMTWGLDYIKGSTEQVGKKTEEYLTCTDMSYKITSVDCATNEVNVQNNANIDITNVTLRIFKGLDANVVIGDGIPSFANKRFTISQGLAGATKVEAIVHIKGSSGKLLLCKDMIEDFMASC